MRQQFIPPRRTWVLTRSECSPTTCAPPAVHDSAGKKFQLCSWTWNIPARSMTPSLLKELTSDRGIDYRASDQRHWEGLEGKALSSGDFQQWNVEACFAISVRFKGEGGVENETNVPRFASFCELLRRPLRESESERECASVREREKKREWVREREKERKRERERERLTQKGNACGETDIQSPSYPTNRAGIGNNATSGEEEAEVYTQRWEDYHSCRTHPDQNASLNSPVFCPIFRYPE